MDTPRIYYLEERLVNFATAIVTVTKRLPYDAVTNHLGNQLLRSGTSCALNYGETMGAESRKDFIHKLRLVIKELRESMVTIKILTRTSYLKADDPIAKVCAELIAIFSKSIVTARNNSNSKQGANTV